MEEYAKKIKPNKTKIEKFRRLSQEEQKWLESVNVVQEANGKEKIRNKNTTQNATENMIKGIQKAQTYKAGGKWLNTQTWNSWERNGTERARTHN